MHRRGQVGQTMTWMVATIIVVVLAFIFIFITGTLASVKGFLGLNIEYLPGEDSGVGSQQMMFALLEKKIGGNSVNELIRTRDFSSVSVIIRESLSVFEKEGVKCSFVIEGLVNLGDDSGGKEVSMSLHGEEVRLRC